MIITAHLNYYKPPLNTFLVMKKLKLYRIFYTFHHSKVGFQNSITVSALNVDAAIENVKRKLSEVYGSKMLERFSFKPDPTYTGVVTH